MFFHQSRKLSLRHNLKNSNRFSEIIFAFLCSIDHLFSHIQKLTTCFLCFLSELDMKKSATFCHIML